MAQLRSLERAADPAVGRLGHQDFLVIGSAVRFALGLHFFFYNFIEGKCTTAVESVFSMSDAGVILPQAHFFRHLLLTTEK